ncbi:uncharacterized protein LOC143018437 [Oratosquilla oratoria]|uniref:uncharacterized protein LOC143018437 n=1 Tax=Oratosquilla oratoria TaxID=337810 RepID=UPI003F77180B
MMLGLKSGTRVALLLMWASCVVTALHLSDKKLSFAMCTDNSDCPPTKECLKGVCSPASHKPAELTCIIDIICPHRLDCCDGVCRPSCEKPDCCPPIKPGHVGPCVLECYGKDDCPGGELCCFNGCGNECKKPYKNCNMTKP